MKLMLYWVDMYTSIYQGHRSSESVCPYVLVSAGVELIFLPVAAVFWI